METPGAELAAEWREEAERMEHRGLAHAAELLCSCAADLEQAIREWELEELSLSEAAEEAGVHYDTARNRLARGDWENVGEKGSPRVRRRDLLPGPDGSGRDDLAEEALRGREVAG